MLKYGDGARGAGGRAGGGRGPRPGPRVPGEQGQERGRFANSVPESFS